MDKLGNVKKHLYSFLIFLFALVSVLNIPTASFAAGECRIDQDTLEFYAKNNILYYCKNSSTGCFNSFGVYGATVEEKVWTALTSFMTAEQAAGAMGNIAHEGMFNPAVHEIALIPQYQPGFALDQHPDVSYGIGLIGWSWGRLIGLYNFIKEQNPELTKYLDDYQTYSPDYSYNGAKFLELAGDEVTNALIGLEIQYLVDELHASWESFFSINNVYDAAVYFLEQVERPRNPYIAYHPERATDAQKYYDQFANATIEGAPSNNTRSSDGSSVTIIGDSLTVRAQSSLQEDSKLPKSTIIAEVGKGWDWGISQASSAKLGNTVVFALGTNSSNITEAQVEQAISTIGEDKTIFFVTNYTTSIDYSSNNALFANAAKKHSNVKVIDWAKTASSDPSKYLDSDGIHQSPEGVKAFTELIYNAVNSSSNGTCLPSSDLQALTLELAWPEWHPAEYIERKPAYADLVADRQSRGRYVGGSVRGVAGIDCGGWVTTLVQESGFEPDYNDGCGGTTTQENWVNSHGWTSLGSGLDAADLQPGDVAFTDGHTWIFVGQIDGFESVIASASYDGNDSDSNYYGRAPMAGKESISEGRWYRKGN